jgi:DNA-binding NarL/FixJ family response regulator
MTADPDAELRVAVRADHAPDLMVRLERALRAPDVAVSADRPAVVVCDGLEDLGAGTAAVVVLDDADHRAVNDALDAGARGVVQLTDVETSLLAAVRAVHAGLVVQPGGVRKGPRGPVLSARERQVLGLVTMQLTNAEIARRLYLSESTVKYHLGSVYAKLGVKSRKEAAAMVLDPRTGRSLGVLNMSGRGRPDGEGYTGPGVS